MSDDHCPSICPFAGCDSCPYPGGPDPDLLTLKEET